MWRAHRSVTVAAALVAGAALAGCAVAAEPPPDLSAPSPTPSAAPPPVAAAPPVLPPLAPPVAVPEPPSPTAHYTPVRPTATPSATPSPGALPAPTPTPAPTAPASLVSLLPSAAALAPLEWRDATGVRTAPWTEASAARGLSPVLAVPHAAAARTAGGGCATAADAVDGLALEAASTSLDAAPAPGGPIDLVLLRYPTPQAASDAAAALQALGAACAGVVTADGTLGSGSPVLDATAVLTVEGAVLVVDARARGDLLIAVVHESAPREAVEALADAQSALLG